MARPKKDVRTAVSAVIWRPRFRNIVFVTYSDGSVEFDTAQTNFDARRNILCKTGISGNKIETFTEERSSTFAQRLCSLLRFKSKSEAGDGSTSSEN